MLDVPFARPVRDETKLAARICQAGITGRRLDGGPWPLLTTETSFGRVRNQEIS